MHVTPKKYTSVFLDNARREACTFIDAATQFDEIDDEVVSFYKSIEASSDFWEVIGLLTEFSRRRYVDVIVSHAPQSLSNYEYLTQVADTFGAEQPKPDKPSTLKRFLTEIPMIRLWEPDFNAFLGRTSPIGSIPHICVYHTLETAVRGFADIILYPILNIHDNRCTQRSIDEIQAIASGMEYIGSVKTLMDFVFGHTWAMTYEKERSFKGHGTPESLILCETVAGGSIDFVWFHEFGHLLMGHLKDVPCHAVEFQADAFAARTMLRVSDERDKLFWYIAGGAATLFLISLLEARRSTSHSSTHPPANDRLMHFLSATIDLYDYNVAALVQGFEAACNPTLSKWWNMTVDITR